MEKRERARAIIFDKNKIVVMFREKNGRTYYTFPGGGKEKNESEEDCVKREVLEEFGMVVKPLKKVYVYENETSLEHFYIAEWISGEFASGNGEEYQEDRNKGVYIPMLIDIANIPSIPLMPPEVASIFYEDYVKNGRELRNEEKYIFGDIEK